MNHQGWDRRATQTGISVSLYGVSGAKIRKMSTMQQALSRRISGSEWFIISGSISPWEQSRRLLRSLPCTCSLRVPERSCEISRDLVNNNVTIVNVPSYAWTAASQKSLSWSNPSWTWVVDVSDVAPRCHMSISAMIRIRVNFTFVSCSVYLPFYAKVGCLRQIP